MAIVPRCGKCGGLLTLFEGKTYCPDCTSYTLMGNRSLTMTSDPMDHLARRVANARFFLASVLTTYQQRHGLDDAELAAQLGCPVGVLTLLRLCRRPGGATPRRTTEEDVRVISERFAIDPDALARIVREVEGD
jgi:hypothetical protein